MCSKITSSHNIRVGMHLNVRRIYLNYGRYPQYVVVVLVVTASGQTISSAPRQVHVKKIAQYVNNRRGF